METHRTVQIGLTYFMQYGIVIYTNLEGYKEFRRVPNSLQPSEYDKGVFAGPPDIHAIGLDEDETLALNNALVDAGFMDFTSLNGRRADLLRLVEKVLNVTSQEANRIRHELMVLYTKEFYPEKYED